MVTLGIHDGHTATACMFEDGEVIACISEERLNREKEWAGFPRMAIDKCLEIARKKVTDVDAIGCCSLMPQTGHRDYNNPSLPKKVFGVTAKMLPAAMLQNQGNITRVQSLGKRLGSRRVERTRTTLREMGFNCVVNFYEHHLLHATTAFYPNWYREQAKTLVITLDGSGDGVCGSVNIGENGRLTRLIGLFNYNSICEFYTKITQHLGMKPMSHEFKVMGLSPYGDDKYRKELVDLFRSFYKIPEDKPLEIINTSGHWRWQYFDLFQKVLFQKRFDNVAGAAQDIYEEIVSQWIRNAIKETGIGHLALSGGGFMNVKLNAKILRLPEVESLFIFPSSGDESNPVGAAIQAALALGYDYRNIKPLKMIYWGPSYTNEDAKQAIDGLLPAEGFIVEFQADIDEYIGLKVAEGKIIGRMSGRMEWGARSLGNRSIVADPRSQQIIHRINRAIKMRDFWMPFAPAVLKDKAHDYFLMKDGFRCPFMVMAFISTPKAQRDIIAGLHPFDDTARAQLVDPEYHPNFYKMIKSFEQTTGVSGVLNTSFNLHGDAVVCTPEDAIRTFLNSDLDGVQINNYYVERVRI